MGFKHTWRFTLSLSNNLSGVEKVGSHQIDSRFEQQNFLIRLFVGISSSQPIKLHMVGYVIWDIYEAISRFIY